MKKLHEKVKTENIAIDVNYLLQSNEGHIKDILKFYKGGNNKWLTSQCNVRDVVYGRFIAPCDLDTLRTLMLRDHKLQKSFLINDKVLPAARQFLEATQNKDREINNVGDYSKIEGAISALEKLCTTLPIQVNKDIAQHLLTLGEYMKDELFKHIDIVDKSVITGDALQKLFLNDDKSELYKFIKIVVSNSETIPVKDLLSAHVYNVLKNDITKGNTFANDIGEHLTGLMRKERKKLCEFIAGNPLMKSIYAAGKKIDFDLLNLLSEKQSIIVDEKIIDNTSILKTLMKSHLLYVDEDMVKNEEKKDPLYNLSYVFGKINKDWEECRPLQKEFLNTQLKILIDTDRVAHNESCELRDATPTFEGVKLLAKEHLNKEGYKEDGYLYDDAQDGQRVVLHIPKNSASNGNSLSVSKLLAHEFSHAIDDLVDSCISIKKLLT